MHSHLLRKDYFLAFERFVEADGPESALRIIVHGSENETDLLLNVPGSLDIWQFDFPSYATYSVTFEDFTVWSAPDSYTGNAYRIYRKSDLLAFMKQRTNLEAQEKERKLSYQHFSLSCMEHQVDVISADAPSIKLLNSK
ncbi:MAG: hypothetical protein ACQEV0_09815 [Bacillota bacterium]